MKRTIKVIAVVLILILLACSLTACGNERIFDLNYTFHYAYINGPSGWKEFEIVRWSNYEDGDMVQVETKAGNIVLGHANTIIITKNKIDFN